MKKYTRPNAEVVRFSVSDIITVSGEVVNASTFTGANAEMYEIYSQNSVAKNENVSVFTW